MDRQSGTATLSYADPQSDAPALRKTCIELEDLADELMMTSDASELDIVCGSSASTLDVRRLLMPNARAAPVPSGAQWLQDESRVTVGLARHCSGQ